MKGNQKHRRAPRANTNNNTVTRENLESHKFDKLLKEENTHVITRIALIAICGIQFRNHGWLLSFVMVFGASAVSGSDVCGQKMPRLILLPARRSAGRTQSVAIVKQSWCKKKR